ncbi:ABC transporter ATP-binding protein [Halorarum halobium]|uniref:ABC transporter ATP-binding protein n=1 Tax=Halorarum halobium TaxID=3075121 RepID=UPI0028B01327|nr:ABC transporter ATP-binding protein [Halobaculum sp. XH14]
MPDVPATGAGDARAGSDPSSPLLEVEDLEVRFFTEEGSVKAVNGVSFGVSPGETVGIVGESGAGKSVTAQSILRLVDSPGRITNGEIRFRGEDVRSYSTSELQELRGGSISMIFQDPQTYLNPVHTVGEQIAEAIRIHREPKKASARERAIEMLDRVGIADPSGRYDDYPHEFSGGMKQRVLIAIALSCDPDVLVADEPTTALDVTTEAQILRLISELSEEFDTAVIFITHDLSVVAELCDRAIVMYAGQIVEKAPVIDLFTDPHHPYTEGLLESIPAHVEPGERIDPIPGQMPDAENLPSGCAFHPRCKYAVEECRQAEPPLVERGDRANACYRYVDDVEVDE